MSRAEGSEKGVGAGLFCPRASPPPLRRDLGRPRSLATGKWGLVQGAAAPASSPLDGNRAASGVGVGELLRPRFLLLRGPEAACSHVPAYPVSVKTHVDTRNPW